MCACFDLDTPRPAMSMRWADNIEVLSFDEARCEVHRHVFECLFPIAAVKSWCEK